MNIIDRTPAMQAHFKDINHECRAIEAGNRPRFAERDQLIILNYRLAVSIASSYKHNGLHVEELIGFAYFGLCKAADRFDPSKGIPFASYAAYWCRKEVIQSLTDCAYPIRLPRYKRELSVSIRQLQNDFFLQNGREPAIGELAEMLNEPEDLIAAIITSTTAFQSLDEHPSEEVG